MAKDEGLRVDFSSKEAESEALSFTPMPSGNYHVKITEITDKESTSEKNYGKPYWNVEMTVQEGKYLDRKLWANVMLFEGALYSLSQLLKATGHADAIKSGKIPNKEVFISKDVLIVVKKQLDEYAMRDADPDDPPIYKNEVKGFKTYQEGALDSASASGGSLLP